ncbi:MAG TPA: GNAT family N-acetyltransferase [Acidimicrobiales bacterium]
MAPEARPLRDDELPAYFEVVGTAFLSPPVSDEELEARRRFIEIDRCLATFDDAGRMCGVARSFATELTVPGGAVRAAAVSGVGVLPTHRRRGHLNALMRRQLDDVRDRGEPVAILVAAEYPIYGRFGYGPAVHACALRIDSGVAWRDEPTGRVELVEGERAAAVAADVYDRVRPTIPGHLSWDKTYWDLQLGVQPLHDGEDASRRDARKVVWYDDDGQAQGVAVYTVTSDWIHNRPEGELSASLALAATPEAERELFRFLTSVDWIATVRAGLRPVDDPLPLRVRDGRAALLVDHSDHLWLRPVDAAAALAARRYATEGTLVLEVVDPAGYAAGRLALDAGPAGASCTPTTRSPDLTVPVAALGAAYLGGTPWTRLAAAGWLDEHIPGAAERARVLFTPHRAPWSATSF